MYQMCVQKKYFFEWNNLIHEKYTTRLAKNLYNHLDRRYAVKQWWQWTRLHVHKRALNNKVRKHILKVHLKKWKTFIQHALATLHADIHWKNTAKKKALFWLQKAAQDRVALRGKSIVAEDHYISFTLNHSLQKWMNYMRTLQELRGKMNQAEDHARTKALRMAFNRIGEPIREYRGKEVLAHRLRDVHKTRKLKVRN
tara:strand:- start:52 stop:645 length:594 start_codon:yes stop_codon:yes gene_type:complete